MVATGVDFITEALFMFIFMKFKAENPNFKIALLRELTYI